MFLYALPKDWLGSFSIRRLPIRIMYSKQKAPKRQTSIGYALPVVSRLGCIFRLLKQAYSSITAIP